MSLFLTMLTCKKVLQEEVIEAIITIMKKHSFELISKVKVSEITGKENQFEVSESENNWIQVFCPETIDANFAKEISKELKTDVFSFSIVEGVYWMYELFVSGTLKDMHVPIPNYWKDISSKEKKKYRGNASILASLLGISKSRIEKYLFFWDLEKENPLQDPWKMLDFQTELGITYPDFEKPESVQLVRLTFRKK